MLRMLRRLLRGTDGPSPEMRVFVAAARQKIAAEEVVQAAQEGMAWLDDTAVLGWPGPGNGGQPWPEGGNGDPKEKKA